MQEFEHPQGGGSLVVAYKVSSKRILIIGGNNVAASRTFYGLDGSAHVTVITPSSCLVPKLQYYIKTFSRPCDAQPYSLQYIDREFQISDLENQDMVFFCLTDTILCERIVLACRQLRIPINAVNFPHFSDFSLTSHFRQGPLQIGITTNRSAPKLGKRIRSMIEGHLPKTTGEAIRRVGCLRKKLHQADPARSCRRMKWLSQICQFWPMDMLAKLTTEQISELLDLYQMKANHLSNGSGEGCPGPARKKCRTERDEAATISYLVPQPHELKSASIIKRSRIQLVGAGPGDPDLLTIKAHRAILEADIILSDKLVPDKILQLVPKSCKIHISRKFPGNQKSAQQELDSLGLQGLRANKRVVRLKAGDPFIFGRGGEEVLFYRSHGYEPEVISGISSAFGGPLSAGIPVTHRNVANQVLVATGRTKDGIPDLPHFCKDRTLVLLMGLGKLEKLMQQLRTLGWPISSSVSVVEKASWPEQTRVTADMNNISKLVKEKGITSPAIIIVGEVVHVLDNQIDPEHNNVDAFPENQIEHNTVASISNERKKIYKCVPQQINSKSSNYAVSTLSEENVQHMISSTIGQYDSFQRILHL